MILRWSKHTSIFSMPGAQHFIDTYAGKDNWHNLDRRTGNLGYGYVHYGLLRTLQPTRVLVVGSKMGFVPAICALALKHNRKGVVDFVDASFNIDHPDDEDRHFGGVGFWRQVEPAQHFSKFALEKYIRTHIMTTDTFNTSHAKRTWQYVYLDGDHSYKGVKRDYRLFWPRLTRRGYLAIHDIYATNATMKELGDLPYGVKRFWNELKRTQKQTLEYPGRYGLGIIHKART